MHRPLPRRRAVDEKPRTPGPNATDPPREGAAPLHVASNSAPVGIQLSTRRAAEATVICVRGELDVLSAPQLAAQLDEVVRAGGDGVIVDLRQTSFIDSTALHVLINSQRRLTRQSRKLTVIADPGPVRRVFELARLIETLGVVSGADD